MENAVAAGTPVRRSYPRGSEEFSRVLAFSDGLFAIAMTLLVVGIEVPNLNDPDTGELWDAINDLTPSITSFFISFAVIGGFWLAHHRFVGLLAAMDRRFIGLNLIYLAFIAFLPFPTGVLGEYFDDPLSVVIYAPTIAICSGLEAAMLVHAHRASLLAHPLSDDVYRWQRTGSLMPLGFFLISIPVAFLSTTLAVLVWFGGVPFGAYLNRRKPPGANEQLGE